MAIETRAKTSHRSSITFITFHISTTRYIYCFKHKIHNDDFNMSRIIDTSDDRVDVAFPSDLCLIDFELQSQILEFFAHHVQHPTMISTKQWVSTQNKKILSGISFSLTT